MRLLALVTGLVVILAWWSGMLRLDAVSIWLARLRPVSVRSVQLTEAERSSTANVAKFLVSGRVSAGAMLRCWVQTYHQGELVEGGEAVVGLEVPLTREGLTIVCSREAVAEEGQWVRYEWTLTSGQTTARGTVPYYSTNAAVWGWGSGPYDLSQGEPVFLCVVAEGNQPPALGWDGTGGILSSKIMEMDYVYVLKMLVWRPTSPSALRTGATPKEQPASGRIERAA